MPKAQNIAFKIYKNGNVDVNWSETGTYYIGYNTNFKINRVMVIRFDLDTDAKTVEVPIQSDKTFSNNAVCYGFGPNPDLDSSMTNKNGETGSAGTFSFSKAYDQVVLNIPYGRKGKNYLYIWPINTSVPSQSSIRSRGTTDIGITYTPAVTYNFTITLDSGVEASVKRLFSNYGKLGNLSPDDLIYQNDRFTISFFAKSGYEITSATLNANPIVSPSAYTAVSQGIALVIKARRSATISIDNGSSFEKYLIYIDDGKDYNMYQAYLDDGQKWLVLN